MRVFLYLALILLLTACQNAGKKEPLFILLSAEQSGIDFRNDVEYTPEFNMYTYRNFYNGGGVGIGDINNDGLADVFFCGNLKDNKLYLNKGGFQFEDITQKAGVASESVWSTGVSFADVNGDGRLDIYVCKSGKPGGEKRHNELFINNGDLTFTEQAKAYGIADEGLSSHAAFFDYDKDGDLDCYLLNNSFRPVGGYDIRPGLREIRDELGGNKLYRNDQINISGETKQGFTDVSEEAGIYGSNIGFGLGVTIGDVNRDGWPDIYVSNDFFERDYLYINQKDGSFQEDLINQMGEISMGSMGADMADINNDGFPEIFVTEMLPETDDRYKTKMTFENWDKYQLNLSNGYHRQFTRNVLQLNNGNKTFSEISRLANVHATDWSWSALIADYDNDGFKDLYVANGIYKDLLDQDYINFYSTDPEIIRALRNREKEAILKLIELIPSEKISNYAFRNKQNLTFENNTEEWGLDIPSHSNGSAYGDLDNDGDLDLVVNNCNMPSFVFRNETDKRLNNRYLQLTLEGEGMNAFAIGAQVTLRHEGQIYYQELAPMRGFLSCTDYKMTFGLGAIDKLEELEVVWPDGRKTILKDVETNRLLVLKQSEAREQAEKRELVDAGATYWREAADEIGLTFKHAENDFVDFDRDGLLYHMVSADGPKMCKGDINGDGREDLFIGGASGQAACLFVQTPDGRFEKTNEALLEEDKIGEDTDAIFFDADGDRDLDLYVAGGGNEFSANSPYLFDRLYINDGKGAFQKSPQQLPTSKPASSACVQAADFDADGDLDLFVGIRLLPAVYGVPVSSYLLENDGQGNFVDRMEERAPELNQFGMVTDALWTDYDLDGDPDLFIVGEWTPLTIFQNNKGRFKNVTSKAGFDRSNGFWNCVKAGDFDQDGDPDFVIGNHGLNTRFKASVERPLNMYVNDFDGNRTAEQIITVYNGDKSYPLVLRHDLTKQLPELKKKYLYYENYKEQTIKDIFTEKQIRTAAKSYIYHTQSSLAWNNGDGTFTLESLPIEAQMAPVYGLLTSDIDRDGNLDVLLGGNFYRSKPEVGIYDGSYGLVLKGDGKGGFQALKPETSGFLIKGEIRDFLTLGVGEREFVLVARNNEKLAAYRN